MYGAGCNSYSQLASGVLNVTTFSLIDANVNNFTSNTWTIWWTRNDKTLWFRGANAQGEGGNGTIVNKAVNTQISGVTDAVNIFNYDAWVASNYPFGCYLTDTGVVKFTGYNREGKFGTSVTSTTPLASNVVTNTYRQPTFAGQGDVVDVVSCHGNVYIRTNDGRVFSSGLQSYRGISKGTYTATDLNTFLQVSLPAPVKDMKLTSYYATTGSDPCFVTCLLETGQVYCFGYSDGNFVGANGLLVPQAVPINQFYNGIAISSYPVGLWTINSSNIHT